MKRRSLISPQYVVPQGHRCDCDCCIKDVAGENHLYQNLTYCSGCGHGYLIAGGGMCSRCGSRGPWLEERPTLPAAPTRAFKVELRRTVTQFAHVVVEARSEKEALLMGHTASPDSWADIAVDDDNERLVRSPFSHAVREVLR
jgi:hypothetical protein